MPERFPIGLIFGAFICAAMAIGMFKWGAPESSGPRSFSLVALSVGLALLFTALLLLASVVNIKWLSRFGPALLLAFVIVTAIAGILDYLSRRRS